MDSLPGMSSLAEGLTTATEGGVPKALYEASALRQAPTAALSPLISHLKKVVRDLVAAAAQPEIDLGPAFSKVSSLAFVLSSTLGKARMDTHDEEELWHITMSLWNASLVTCRQPNGDDRGDLLHALGSEIFQVVEGECDATRDVSQYIQYLCQAANEWESLGVSARAAWCVRHAVGYAERLESLIASERLPADLRERCVLQLFGVYLQAASSSNRSNEQSLANNMLARALQLSKHEVVSRRAAATMSLGIARLQLAEAQTMMAAGGIPAVATVMLDSSLQHLEGALEAAESAGLVEMAAEVRREETAVVAAAAKAHLAEGDPEKAVQKLQGVVGSEHGGFGAMTALLVTAHLACNGGVAAAAEVLLGAAPRLEEGAQGKEEEVTEWIGCFKNVAAGADGRNAIKVANAALAFMHSAAATPARISDLLKYLMAGGKSDAPLLRVLASDEAATAVCKDPGTQASCHSMLRTLAAQRNAEGAVGAAADLLTAALQYSPLQQRPHTACLVAACHLNLGAPRKALEYLEVAAKGGAPAPSFLAPLVKMTAALQQGELLEARQAVSELPDCADFHYSVSHAASQAAIIVGSDSVTEALAASLAVKNLIPDVEPADSRLAAGQEAALISAWAVAMLRRFKSDAAALRSSGESDFEDLVGAMKMTTRRVKALGLSAFAGDAASLEKLASLGYRAALEALKSGAYDRCVTLSSSVCVVLDVLEEAESAREDKCALYCSRQAQALLLAAQSLLAASRGAQSARARVQLASRLLKKATGKVTAADAAGAALAVSCLALRVEVAAAQRNEKALVAALQELQPVAHQLTLPQLSEVVKRATAAVGNNGGDGCGAACGICAAVSELLMAVGASLPASLLPEMVQLAQGAQQQLRACHAAAAVISSVSAAAGDAAEPVVGLSLRRQWLAGAVVNIGASLMRAAAPRRAVLFFLLACDVAAGGDDAAPAGSVMTSLRQRAEAALEAARAAAAAAPISPPPAVVMAAAAAEQPREPEIVPKEKRRLGIIAVEQPHLAVMGAVEDLGGEKKGQQHPKEQQAHQPTADNNSGIGVAEPQQQQPGEGVEIVKEDADDTEEETPEEMGAEEAKEPEKAAAAADVDSPKIHTSASHLHLSVVNPHVPVPTSIPRVGPMPKIHLPSFAVLSKNGSGGLGPSAVAAAPKSSPQQVRLQQGSLDPPLRSSPPPPVTASAKQANPQPLAAPVPGSKRQKTQGGALGTKTGWLKSMMDAQGKAGGLRPRPVLPAPSGRRFVAPRPQDGANGEAPAGLEAPKPSNNPPVSAEQRQQPPPALDTADALSLDSLSAV